MVQLLVSRTRLGATVRMIPVILFVRVLFTDDFLRGLSIYSTYVVEMPSGAQGLMRRLRGVELVWRSLGPTGA